MTYKNIIIPLGFFGNISGDNEIYKFLSEIALISIQKSFRTFHFFFEKGRLEIRIDGSTDSCIDLIKDYFKQKGMDEENIKKIIINDYIPEIKDYGNTGWNIIEKVFEYGALAAIYIRTGGFGEDKENRERDSCLFRETKLIHCFLNQLGFDSLGEASFHNFAAQQMMIKHIREVEIPIYATTQPIAIIEDKEKDKNKDSKGQGPEFG